MTDQPSRPRLELVSPDKNVSGPPPTRYDPSYCEQVQKAAESGFTVYEIERLLKVTSDTLQLWVMMYPDFAKAMKANDEARTRRVESALYQRAIGYDYNGAHYPADVGAANRWLEAKDPETWTRHSTLSGPGGGPVQLEVEMIDAAATFDDKFNKYMARVESERLVIEHDASGESSETV